VMDVANRQTRTCVTEVDQRAPFKKVIRRSLNPSRLIEGSPKEPTPMQEMRAHLVSASATSGRPGSRLDDLSNEPGRSALSEVSKGKCKRRQKDSKSHDCNRKRTVSRHSKHMGLSWP